MSDETTHSGFSKEQVRILIRVLDELIPPSSDGKLPGAGELGVASYIEDALRNTPDLMSMITQGLSDLDEQARSRNERGFAGLSPQDKVQLLNDQAFVLPLTFHTYIGYYQDERIVKALGLEARPPHPDGYSVEPNDLAILEPVRRRSKLYRDC